MDESYYGAEEKNKHTNQRTKATQGRCTITKTLLSGMIERGVKLNVSKVYNVKSEAVIQLYLPMLKEAL